MTKNGIDVSEWQGDINWSSINTDFCIIRAGYGREISQKDKKFEANYNGCKSRSIPCGAYWYSYAVTPDEAVKEANVFLQVIKGKKFEYPIFVDIEEKRQLDLGKAAVSAIIRAFLDTLEKAGYWAGLYMSSSLLTAYTDENIRKRYSIWVAHYGVSKPSYSGSYSIWQKSSTGSSSGISGNVDLNECYIDYPTEMRSAGLNGYQKNNKDEEEVTLTIGEKTYTGKLKEK